MRTFLGGSLSAGLAAAVLAAPCPAAADEPAATPDKPATSPPAFTFTGNMTLASDYRFRGLSQTFAEGGELGPAIQGGLDLAHESGGYVGNWNSNVSGNQYPNGDGIEMDFYGGWKRAFGDYGIDLGTIYYHYPRARFTGLTDAAGNPTSERINNWELYAGGGWRWFSARYFYALTNYFGASEDVIVSLDSPSRSDGALARNGDTRGTQYLTAALAVPLAPQLTANAGVGVTWVHNYHELDYVDYRAGLTYDLHGWLLGVALVGTNADRNLYYAASGATSTKDIGELGFVVSVNKIF